MAKVNALHDVGLEALRVRDNEAVSPREFAEFAGDFGWILLYIAHEADPIRPWTKPLLPPPPRNSREPRYTTGVTRKLEASGPRVARPSGANTLSQAVRSSVPAFATAALLI